ncbi:MAG: hypothetical protein IIA89_15645 [Chloroflexi bacterium]|nr:hypothetical protein [Chloroflexota bacterium]
MKISAGRVLELVKDGRLPARRWPDVFESHWITDREDLRGFMKIPRRVG